MGKKKNEQKSADSHKVASKPLVMLQSTDLDGTKHTKQTRAHSRHYYAMEELLVLSDYSLAQNHEDREWVDAPSVGQELL